MKIAALKQVAYDPSVFLNIETVEEARDIIVTPFDKLTSQHRWDTETPYLIGLIERWLRPRARVLDYGCGIGRLAKPLIEKHGCKVVGVDISPNMRALAASCVNSDLFMAVPPGMLSIWIKPRLCDFAIAIWTLQHVLELGLVINDIENMLTLGGKLFVVNDAKIRYVPVADGWIDDGVDVRAVLQDHFTELEYGQLEGDDIAPGSFKENNFWAVYQK
jgi:SAM-dependent methyltransferase